ncbi:MAG: cell division protein FtsW [Lachnospiraceae bacterium]|nr:cell division protein FtsW [Lachnospiraceae bacterium]
MDQTIEEGRREKTKKKEKRLLYFDFSLLVIILTLVGFGLVMLYSSSSYSGQEKFGDAAYFLKKQMMSAGIGFAAMILIALIPPRFWEKVSLPFYVFSILLCALVPFIGVEINYSKRWLKIGGQTFQPSEIAKVATIVFFAAVLCRIPKVLNSLKKTLMVFLMALPVIGIVAISNLSTAIILAGIVFVMLFVTSPKYWHYLLALALLCLGMLLVVYLASKGGDAGNYRFERVQVWLDPENHEKGYQTLQGLYAIGSGGVFGKGLGESMQKLGFIPEAQNDMIFSIICEELGLFGAVCVILLFLLMLWRFMMIASNARDLFSSLLVVGIMAHISLQVMLNIAVVTNTIPNTGIILPFISYGGTSVIFLLAEMGIALSVSRIRLN